MQYSTVQTIVLSQSEYERNDGRGFLQGISFGLCSQACPSLPTLFLRFLFFRNLVFIDIFTKQDIYIFFRYNDQGRSQGFSTVLQNWFKLQLQILNIKEFKAPSGDHSEHTVTGQGLPDYLEDSVMVYLLVL